MKIKSSLGKTKMALCMTKTQFAVNAVMALFFIQNETTKENIKRIVTKSGTAQRLGLRSKI